MNTPNKLTLLRILMVPLIVIASYISAWNTKVLFDEFTLANLIVLILFILASLTDTLDGYLARKNNQVTDFGKLTDPLADKIMVITALLVLLKWNRMYDFVIIIVIFREFLITGLRQIAVSHGQVIAASYFGKSKTVSQCIMIIYLLIFAPDFSSATGIIGNILIIISTALAVLSGIDYFVRNKNVIESK